ncbi:MAG: hypothetical protein A3F91_02145 [Flavobacteria bacterium RIFCSPLOWO2_12_FULL_35_11]|nr:MAG: hypothetical protein A3F91_02145 [Flavobacteria bacterium RIFCSPLOWO2_12_FULL_35_11]
MYKDSNNIIKALDRYFNRQKKIISSLFIDEQTAMELLIDIDFKVKGYLINLFGKEKKITVKGGCFNDLLPYLNKGNPYSDSVIYSYWTYRGESDIYKVEEKNGEWRRNFFYKGKRWSEDWRKDNFYHFFKFFENISNGKNPVEFFIELGTNSKEKKICVQFFDKELPTSPDKNTIFFPSIKYFSKHNKIKEFILLVARLKKAIADENFISTKNKNYGDEYFKKTFKPKFDSAYKEFATDSELGKIVYYLVSLIKKTFNLMSEDKIRSQIVNVILTLLYFDQPYKIHFFLPQRNGLNNDVSENTKRESKKLISPCLIITTHQSKNISETSIEKFSNLISVLIKHSELEQEIWNKRKELLPTYHGFKGEYLEIEERYLRLAEIIISIIKAISDEHNREDKFNKIAFFYDLYRTKEFDSFFHKVIEIANKKNNNTKQEKLRHKLFSKILRSGDKKNIDKLFNKLTDVVGARIVCVFESNTKIILDKLDELNNNGQIKIVDKKDYEPSRTNNNFYRSYHRTMILGNERKKIYEFQDLQRMKCELQIRTLLQDAWANASHHLTYKRKYPKQLLEVQNKILPKFEELSKSLIPYDKGFDKSYKDFQEVWKKIQSVHIS